MQPSECGNVPQTRRIVLTGGAVVMRTKNHSKTLALVALLTWSGCVLIPRVPPPPTPPSAEPLSVVKVDAAQEWTDSGLVVRKGERLIFWATGQIQPSAKPNRILGPDGDGGLYYRVGKGGLVGRIGNGRPFTVGARTHLFRRGGKSSHLPFAPPPIEMKQDGTLRLGLKDWRVGSYQGAFSVSIWSAP